MQINDSRRAGVSRGAVWFRRLPPPGHESLDVTLAYLKAKDAESEEALAAALPRCAQVWKHHSGVASNGPAERL
jgi:hypothetical protein